MGVKFTPIQCTEQTFKTLATQPTEGAVYFVTDKKKIFLGKDNEMIPMCANSGIFYGDKEIEYDNSGTMPDPNVTFKFDNIKGSDVPEIDDLILNIGTENYPDGCFYRVVDIADDGVDTIRVTLQGSGGGAVAPGPDSDGTTTNLNLTRMNNQQTYYFSKSGEKAILGIVAHSFDATNYITKIECSFSDDINNEDAKFIVHDNLAHALEEAYPINIIEHLGKMNLSDSTTIHVHVTDKYGNNRAIRFYIYVVALSILSSNPTMLSSMDDIYDYYISLSGSNALSNYAIHVEYYNENNDLVLDPPQEIPIEKNQISANTLCSLDLSSLPHGAYTMKMYLTAKVGIDTLSSNILTHKMIRYREGGDPILGILIPDKCEQYTPIPINYLLVCGDSIKEYNLEILLDNNSITTEKVTSGVLGTYNLIVNKAGTYRLKTGIDELSILQDFEMPVLSYSGILPVINVDRNDLETYLTAQGRTNNSADKNFWPDTKNKERKAVLSGFHFRTVDGWLKDSNNIDYLKISQGATVEFKDYSPYSKSPNTKGLTIELDFELKGVSNYNQSLIECISYTRQGNIKTGFKVTGDRFIYYVNGKEITSLNLVKDKRIKIAYVVDPAAKLCYAYLEGIISNIYQFDKDGVDFEGTTAFPGYLKINSSAGQINLYSVRFYSTALNAATIVNNYQASLGTLAEREASFLSNQIYNIDNIIDLNIIESAEYPLEIPYVKIVGGYEILKDKNSGDMIMSAQSSSNVPALPTGKKDFRAIDISVHYPKTEYFKDYTDFSVTSQFSGGGSVIDSFGKTLSTGAWMYAQGTSSMEYPVKNLRVKFKGHKIKVQPDLDAVNLICFKADFMESSGSHNTGAGNFIDNVAYRNVGMKTPAQKHFSNENLVTCIKGHPCVIFWSPTGEKNSFRYIGKYNLNLDKATPEPFGFKYDEADEAFGHLTQSDGTPILDDDKNLQNAIYCFEFLDNNEAVCNFRHDIESTYKDYDAEIHKASLKDDGSGNLTSDLKYEINTDDNKTRYRNSWYQLRINEDNDIVHGWMRGFESRYPEDKEDLHDADVLFELASWINDLYNLNEINHSEAITKFKNEYWKHLDEEFTVAYYVITEALLMADSRVKNMMIATWGKEHRYFNAATGEILSSAPKDMTGWEHSFDYIWYPIFYDMDTMMGLDNVGYLNKKYDAEDTDDTTFNGDEVLWKFVRDALPEKIAAAYKNFEEKNALRKENVLPCFNMNQADLANETFYNEDAKYKYIDPFVSNHSGARLFPAQGSRSLDREYFVENRLRYLSGKYFSTDHIEKDRFFFRLVYPNNAAVDTENPKPSLEEQAIIKMNKSIKSVPPSGEFKLTSAKTCYAGVKVGTVLATRKFINEEEKIITIDTSSANGTEVYISGISGLTDVGDLSDKYPYAIDVKGMKDSVIKKLKIGNHHKDYYNPFFADDSLDFSILAYLEELNLENCGSFTKGINFKAKPAVLNPDGSIREEATPGCSKLKKFLGNGSNMSSLTLPVGGVIEELRLPTSITNLHIDSHENLTKDKFTIGYYDYDQDKYVNNFSNIINLYIKNTPIDTYAIVKESKDLDKYYLEGFDWVLNQADDFEIQNGKIIGIKALDRLSKLGPIDTIRELALIGNICIDIADYEVNEYEIYNKYIQIYPNVKITYGQNTNGLVAAHKINFYRIDANSLSADTDITTKEYYYNTFTDGKQTLKKLISNSEFTTPAKMPSNTHNYQFSGVWIDWNTKIEYYQDEALDESVDIKDNSKLFSVYEPVEDMNLVPKYIATTRYYNIDFYEGKDEKVFTLQGEYGNNIGTLCGSDAKYFYRYKDDSDLSEHQRYGFKGWKSEKDFDEQNKNPKIINLQNETLLRSIKLYAHYEIEDARKTASDLNIFDIQYESSKLVNGSYIGGYSISLKPEFKSIIEGKITLPSKDSNGNNITIMNNFNEANKITRFYFLEDAAYTHIADSSCQSLIKLECVYFPSSLIVVGKYAFKDVKPLKTITLGNNIKDIGEEAFHLTYGPGVLEINKLPESIKNIGTRAFCNRGPKVTISKIPDSVETIGHQTFYSCENVMGSLTNVDPDNPTIDFGGGSSNLKSIGHMAFAGTGINSIAKTIKIHSPVQLLYTNNILGTFKDGYNKTGYNKLTHFLSYDMFGFTDTSAFIDDLFGKGRSSSITFSDLS